MCGVSFDRGCNRGDWLSVKINKGVDFVWNMPSHYFELTSLESVLESLNTAAGLLSSRDESILLLVAAQKQIFRAVSSH